MCDEGTEFDEPPEDDDAWHVEHFGETMQEAYRAPGAWKKTTTSAESGGGNKICERETHYVDNLKRWPIQRLQDELDRLQASYFPGLTGRVFVRAAVIATIDDDHHTLGCHDAISDCQVVIDLCRRTHRSARQIRVTLLHELCHAAAGPGPRCGLLSRSRAVTRGRCADFTWTSTSTPTNWRWLRSSTSYRSVDGCVSIRSGGDG